jgi:hypothetical protein
MERNLVGETISAVIKRADELAEILAIYWKDNPKQPTGKNAKVPRQLKAGIAKAFRKFNEYQLGKWNRDGEVKLRDALFISHAMPKDDEQKALWKKLVDGTLAAPDTWEVALSRGADKKETFSRLIKEEKLGYMALLMNLRNCLEAGVDKGLIEEALISGAKDSWALPFRFITAAKHAPKLEESLGKAMIAASQAMPKLVGHTLLVIDVSGSMNGRLSDKSEMTRMGAAAGLAILMRERADEITIYATGGNDTSRIHATALVPSRHGFALSDAILQQYEPLGGGGIFLKQCMEYIDDGEKRFKFDRVVCVTDEQDCDIEQTASQAKKLGRHNYILNVGVYEPALPVTGAGWTRVSGFSERIIDWMMADESENTFVKSQAKQ